MESFFHLALHIVLYVHTRVLAPCKGVLMLTFYDQDGNIKFIWRDCDTKPLIPELDSQSQDSINKELAIIDDEDKTEQEQECNDE